MAHRELERGRDQPASRNGLTSSLKKMLPVCLAPGKMLGCMADGACGSPEQGGDLGCDGEDSLRLSQLSITPIWDKERSERRARMGDARMRTMAEPSVTLSVHGWAKGHEREVVDMVKTELYSLNIKVHEIVSPADILLIFHDMRMGLHAEHLLGRIRHTAAYSGAKAVVLILMDSCTSSKPKKPSDSDQAPASTVQKHHISERKWAMLTSATSLVATYTYGADGTNALAASHNLKNTRQIINHIREWVQGRDYIGMSIESCLAGRSSTRKMPTVSLRDIMGSPGGKLNMSLASLSASKHQALTRNIDYNSFVDSQANAKDASCFGSEPVFLVNNMRAPPAKLTIEYPALPNREATGCASHGLSSRRAFDEKDDDVDARNPQYSSRHERNMFMAELVAANGSSAISGRGNRVTYAGQEVDSVNSTHVAHGRRGDRCPLKPPADRGTTLAERLDRLEDFNCDRSARRRKDPSSVKTTMISDSDCNKMSHTFHHPTTLTDMGDAYEMDML